MVDYPLALVLFALAIYPLWLHRRKREDTTVIDFAPAFLLNGVKTSTVFLQGKWVRTALLALRILAIVLAVLIISRFHPLRHPELPRIQSGSAFCVITDNVRGEAARDTVRAQTALALTNARPDDVVMAMDRTGRRIGPMTVSEWQSGDMPDAGRAMPETGVLPDRRRSLSRQIREAAAWLAIAGGDHARLIIACRLDESPPPVQSVPEKIGVEIIPFDEKNHDNRVATGAWRLIGMDIVPNTPVRLVLPVTVNGGTNRSELSATLSIAPAAPASSADVRRIPGSLSSSPADRFMFIVSFPGPGQYLGEASVMIAEKIARRVPLAVTVRSPLRTVVFTPNDTPRFSELTVQAIRDALDRQSLEQYLRVYDSRYASPDDASHADIIVFSGVEPTDAIWNVTQRRLAAGALAICLDMHHASTLFSTHSLPYIENGKGVEMNAHSTQAVMLYREPDTSNPDNGENPVENNNGHDRRAAGRVLNAFNNGRNGGLLRLKWRAPNRIVVPEGGRVLARYGGADGTVAVWTKQYGAGRIWWTPLGFDSTRWDGTRTAARKTALLVLLREIIAAHHDTFPIPAAFGTREHIVLPLPAGSAFFFSRTLDDARDGKWIPYSEGISNMTGKTVSLPAPNAEGLYRVVSPAGEVKWFSVSDIMQSPLLDTTAKAVNNEWSEFAKMRNPFTIHLRDKESGAVTGFIVASFWTGLLGSILVIATILAVWHDFRA